MVHVYSCYFPTAWDADERAEQLYDVLEVILDCSRKTSATPIPRGEFNANVGSAPNELVGMFGQGCRNERGWCLSRWVLSHQFDIASRMAAAASTVDSWTLKRAHDGAMVQLDYIVFHLRFETTATSHDFSIGIGVEPCAGHCQLQLRFGQQCEFQRKRRHFRNWQPHLDDNCRATRYQVMLRKLLEKQSNINFESMGSCLHIAAMTGGSCSRARARFDPSPTQRDLRLRRRACADSPTRKK